MISVNPFSYRSKIQNQMGKKKSNIRYKISVKSNINITKKSVKKITLDYL